MITVMNNLSKIKDNNMTGSTLNISYLISKHYISMLYTNEDMRKMEILSINFVKPAKCIITSVEEK